MLKPTTLVISLAFAFFVNTTCEASELEPYQQAALEKILATVDPTAQAAARQYLEPTLASLSEQEVAMMLASMAPDGDQEPGGNVSTGPFADACAEYRKIGSRRWMGTLRAVAALWSSP